MLNCAGIDNYELLYGYDNILTNKGPFHEDVFSGIYAEIPSNETAQ